MNTRIVLKHRKYRGSHPYICHGVDGQQDAACETFGSALDAARGMGCDTVLVGKTHAPEDAHGLACRAGITLLIDA